MKRVLLLIAATAVLFLSAIAGLSIRQYGFGLVRISGTSMNDTLRDGDIALITRCDYRDGRVPQLRDVVECRLPGRGDTYIKRVMGLPGNRVTLGPDGLSIDGFPVSEPYVSSAAETFEVLLGPDEYLLLGDNRAESYDSRMPDIGPVGRDAFSGRARFIVWPPDRIGRVE